MRRLIAICTAVTVTGLTILAGCGGSGDNTTLAKVGDYNITLREFKEYTRSLPAQFVSADEEFEVKRDALDSLIVTRLLVQAAYEKNLENVEEISRAVLANRDKFLLDELHNRNIRSQVEISEADIKEFYNMREYKIRAEHIQVRTQDTAQMLFERLKQGADFEQLAYEYSIDPGAKRNRGDLGYFLWGAMPDEFQEAAFQMEAGEISPPVQTDFGWHIIKVTERSPNEMRRSYDEMKENYEGQLRSRRIRQRMSDYMEEIRAKYPITVEKSTCDYVIHKREQLYPPQVLKNLPATDFDIEQLDRNERELVLATWEGGSVSLVEYLTRIQNVPRNLRPLINNYDSVKAMVFQLKVEDILAYEATKQGIENDPEFQQRLQRYREYVMADMLRNDSIQQAEAPTEEEIRVYYQEHPDEFSNPAQIHLYEILVSDELKAEKLAREIRSLEEFKEKALDMTERPGKRQSGGDLGYIEREWYPEIFPRAWKTPIGGIGGPVMTNGKYSVFYVVDRKEAELKDFLGVKRQITAQMMRQRSAEKFENWVEERKNMTSIDVNEDAIWETIDKQSYAAVDTSSGALN